MLQRVVSPVLVGRQEELSQLEDALLSANRGDGRFILLAGEAGIGKTRLAAELAQRARKLGFDVLRGSCSESELALPYLPFVEAVGNRLDEADAAALRIELGPTAGELGPALPAARRGCTAAAGRRSGPGQAAALRVVRHPARPVGAGSGPRARAGRHPLGRQLDARAARLRRPPAGQKPGDAAGRPSQRRARPPPPPDPRDPDLAQGGARGDRDRRADDRPQRRRARRGHPERRPGGRRSGRTRRRTRRGEPVRARGDAARGA